MRHRGFEPKSPCSNTDRKGTCSASSYCVIKSVIILSSACFLEKKVCKANTLQNIKVPIIDSEVVRQFYSNNLLVMPLGFVLYV